MYPFPAMPFYGSFVADEVRALGSIGVDVDVLFINGKQSRLNYLFSPARFFSMVGKGYDVVHVHHSFCGFVATWQRRVPVVWTFHEGEISSDVKVTRSDAPVKRLAYSKGFKRSVARKVDALIIVAEHLKEPLERPDAVTIASGVDTALFKPMDRAGAKRELGLDPDKRFVLFPSTPARVEKRHHIAAGAVEKVREREGVDVELLCLDNVPHDRVPLYMNASEAMLMTSAFEASPVTIREALSCDLPVLSTDVGDARTVLANIEGCYIVEADADRVAEALARSLSGEGRVAGRGPMQEHSLESVASKVLGVYQEVIARRGQAAP